MDTKRCKITKSEILPKTLLKTTETLYSCYIHYKFHDMSAVVFPRQHNGFQAKSYLLLLFLYWVWANMDITLEQQITHLSFWKGRGLLTSMLQWWRHSQYHIVWFLQYINPATFQPGRRQIFHFFFILFYFHFVSTMWLHKSSNVHKSKS